MLLSEYEICSVHCERMLEHAPETSLQLLECGRDQNALRLNVRHEAEDER